MKIHEAGSPSQQLKIAKEVYKQLTGYNHGHSPGVSPAEIIDGAIETFQDRNHRNRSGRDPLRSGPALNQATKLGIKWNKNKLARSDRRYMKIKEDAPVNNAGGGEVAGLGVGADGEPGVDLRQPLGDLRKRRKRCKEVEKAACEAGLAEDASDTFAGGDVMDVDLERVMNAMSPKKPWERFSKYVGVDEVGENIRVHARKNWKKNIILRDAKTGIMTYLRRRK